MLNHLRTAKVRCSFLLFLSHKDTFLSFLSFIAVTDEAYDDSIVALGVKKSADMCYFLCY